MKNGIRMPTTMMKMKATSLVNENKHANYHIIYTWLLDTRALIPPLGCILAVPPVDKKKGKQWSANSRFEIRGRQWFLKWLKLVVHRFSRHIKG
jgi:hypothetical protein